MTSVMHQPTGPAQAGAEPPKANHGWQRGVYQGALVVVVIEVVVIAVVGVLKLTAPPTSTQQAALRAYYGFVGSLNNAEMHPSQASEAAVLARVDLGGSDASFGLQLQQQLNNEVTGGYQFVGSISLQTVKLATFNGTDAKVQTCGSTQGGYQNASGQSVGQATQGSQAETVKLHYNGKGWLVESVKGPNPVTSC